MKTLALHGRPRRLLAWLHRWSGLAILVCVLVASATGVVLAFRDEVDRLINPRLFVVTPRSSTAALHDVITSVEARFPGAYVSSMTFPRRADESLAVFLRPLGGGRRTRGSADPLAINSVFVDPYSGAILGARSSTKFALTREATVPVLLRLHYSLLLGRTGIWVMGIAAAVWLLTNIVGLALAWPSAWQRVQAWLPILSVRGGGAYRVNYDVHRAGSVWLLPVLTMLAFTSVYLSFPTEFRAAVRTISPPVAALQGSPFTGQPTVHADAALAGARGALPQGRPSSLSRDFASGWYSVRFRLPDDVGDSANSQVYVDFRTGVVLDTRLAAEAPRGDRFVNWLFPLHSGQAFGLAGRIFIALTAAILLVLSGSGVYVWYFKSDLRRAVRARRRHGSAAPAGAREPALARTSSSIAETT